MHPERKRRDCCNRIRVTKYSRDCKERKISRSMCASPTSFCALGCTAIQCTLAVVVQCIYFSSPLPLFLLLRVLSFSNRSTIPLGSMYPRMHFIATLISFASWQDNRRIIPRNNVARISIQRYATTASSVRINCAINCARLSLRIRTEKYTLQSSKCCLFQIFCKFIYPPIYHKFSRHKYQIGSKYES